MLVLQKLACISFVGRQYLKALPMGRLTRFLEAPLQLGYHRLHGRLCCLGHLGHGTLKSLQVGTDYICLEGPQLLVSVLNALHGSLVAYYGSIGCYVAQLLFASRSYGNGICHLYMAISLPRMPNAHASGSWKHIDT